MDTKWEKILPEEIEKRSMEIISEELDERGIFLRKEHAPVIMRAIHATADFDYAENLYFSEDVVTYAISLIKKGVCIVTDTKMAWSGINKRALERFGGAALNFIGDSDVAELAKEHSTTRSAAAVDKAAKLGRPLIFAIGNAPTALLRICELYREGRLKPALVIGMPVGFVNVAQAKELILQTDLPCIVARGRKGGSNVCAAVCNALIYMAEKELL